jgi:serine/threonine-protein phosphatase 2A regulatory subunit B''
LSNINELFFDSVDFVGVYLNLDQDHNGMLKKEELQKYGTGTLTPVFVDRVFQECLTYEGEMDFKT